MSEFKFVSTRKHPGKLVQIPKEEAMHMLNVLPPVYEGGFMGMGEPVSHTNDGHATFYWWQERGSKFFATYGTRGEAYTAFAKGEIAQP